MSLNTICNIVVEIICIRVHLRALSCCDCVDLVDIRISESVTLCRVPL